MKKKFFAIFMIAVVIFVLAACGVSRDEYDRTAQERDRLQEELDALRSGGDENNAPDRQNGNGGGDLTAPANNAPDRQNENVGDAIAPAHMPGIGEIFYFGGRDWLVLDIDGSYAKLLHETVITYHSYHHTIEEVTWETSSSRAWLNGEFFDSFSAADRARIRETYVINNDNPWTFHRWFWHWDSTPGGANTTDRIFLLSIEETARHFGGSDLLELGRNESNRDGSIAGLYYRGFWEDNAISNARIAYDDAGSASWWWLRSPGGSSLIAAGVRYDGFFYVDGSRVDNIWAGLGLRPAMWVNIEQ